MSRMKERAPKLSAGFWFPSDPKFRKQYKEAVVAAVRKIGEHHDTSHLTKLINTIEDETTRKKMLRDIMRQLPLAYDLKKGSLKIKKEAGTFDWTQVSEVKVFEKIIQFYDDTVAIGGIEFSGSEFVDEVIDSMILARKIIPDEAVERLVGAAQAILSQRRKGSSPR